MCSAGFRGGHLGSAVGLDPPGVREHLNEPARRVTSTRAMLSRSEASIFLLSPDRINDPRSSKTS